MHLETYPAFLTPRDKKLSLSSSEKKILRVWLARNKKKWKIRIYMKNRASALFVDSIYWITYILLLQWMQGNIYRDVFPTFLTKKSYGWWITRRRMEIHTKISEEKYPKVSVANIGKH